MSGPAVLIREIHRLRHFIRELEEQIERAPRQLKAQQAKVARQEELQREGQEALKKLKITTHEKEVSLKATHNLIAKHQQQLQTATSKKEYDAFQVEIKHEREQAAKLEDEILNAMGETEERTAKLPELEQNVQKAKQDFAAWQAGSKDRLAGFETQLREAQAQLKTVEEKLPKNVLPQFQRVINAFGPDAMAAVRNGCCVTCSTEITAQAQNDLLAGNFVMCKACGRILYLPEESAAIPS
jgi:predicted  nucleic acid-binding Zn-ribbon protein